MKIVVLLEAYAGQMKTGGEVSFFRTYTADGDDTILRRGKLVTRLAEAVRGIIEEEVGGTPDPDNTP